MHRARGHPKMVLVGLEMLGKLSAIYTIPVLQELEKHHHYAVIMFEPQIPTPQNTTVKTFLL